jgi:CelD/BcsL family acetyltransferase involved in cellulose biosynthesis
LPSTWDEFVQQLSKSRRERLRQLTRKYFDTRRARTRWVENIADLDDAFAMFVDMHQRRRRSLGQPGCYSSRQFADFHAEVSRRLCAQGKLRLLWTELDRRPVGAEYDFIDGRTVYYYSTGVEPDATADHPGWLAMIGSLRRAIDEGCRWFDFLRGDEAYKCSWGARPFATLETRVIARRRLAGLRYQAWLGRQQLRKWGKGIKEWNSRRKATTPKTEQT